MQVELVCCVDALDLSLGSARHVVRREYRCVVQTCLVVNACSGYCFLRVDRPVTLKPVMFLAACALALHAVRQLCLAITMFASRKRSHSVLPVSPLALYRLAAKGQILTIEPRYHKLAISMIPPALWRQLCGLVEVMVCK